ncbi:MAG: zf-HC2 domain-containing protein [bacterium]
MKCRDVERALSAYLDGEVTLSEWREAQSHIDGCAGCAQLLANFESSTFLLKQGLRQHEPAPEVWTEIQKRIDMAEQPAWNRRFVFAFERFWQSFVLRPSWSVRAVQIGVAVLLLVGLGARRLWQNASQQATQTAVTAPDTYSVPDFAQEENKRKSLQAAFAAQITKYFDKAGVLLLEVKNSDLDHESSEWSSLRRASQDLLEETILIKEDLKDEEVGVLKKTVEQLEMVLFDIANLKETPESDELEFLKATILQKDLLIKIEIFDARDLENLESEFPKKLRFPNTNKRNTI